MSENFKKLIKSAFAVIVIITTVIIITNVNKAKNIQDIYRPSYLPKGYTNDSSKTYSVFDTNGKLYGFKTTYTQSGNEFSIVTYREDMKYKTCDIANIQGVSDVKSFEVSSTMICAYTLIKDDSRKRHYDFSFNQKEVFITDTGKNFLSEDEIKQIIQSLYKTTNK